MNTDEIIEWERYHCLECNAYTCDNPEHEKQKFIELEGGKKKMKQINCQDCGCLFSYEPNPNFPDTRKYCDDCSAKRKASFEASKRPAQKPIAQPQAPIQQNKPIVQEAKPTVSLVRTENADSIEIGTPEKGGVVKVYGDFNDLEEFRHKLENAKTLRQFANDCLFPIELH